jgi:Zn-dependent protease
MDSQPPPGSSKPEPLPGSGTVDTDYGIPILGELPRADSAVLSTALSSNEVPASSEARTADPATPAERLVRDPNAPIRRKVVVPLVLFLATCASTFYAGSWPIFSVAQPGAFADYPWFQRDDLGVVPGIQSHLHRIVINQRYVILGRWHDGLVYMGAVMAILLAHEMGHFLYTLRYRVPASYPIFIPMPVSPIGTMGAVIAMDSSVANRKAMFDIGIAGPLAGLAVALPIAWFGIIRAVPFPMNIPPGNGVFEFHAPLLFKLLFAYLHPELQPGQSLTLTPLLMAGWTGMLITGLNMLPISQLDGGHVAYALFGKRAHTLARLVVLAAIAYIVVSGVYGWAVMLGVVLFIGIDHPPTHDDSVPISFSRRLLGLASLVIPILCLAPNPLSGG